MIAKLRYPVEPNGHEGTQAVAGYSPPWLTSSDVCRLLSVSDGWLRRAVRTGLVPSVKVGGLRRFRYRDLVAMIDQLSIAGPPEHAETDTEIGISA